MVGYGRLNKTKALQRAKRKAGTKIVYRKKLDKQKKKEKR
jgi:hypothetical protein